METKPSLKTSEFWIHAALQLFFLLDTLKVYSYIPARWSGILQSIIAAAYMVSRGQAKSGVPASGATLVATETDDPATLLDE